MDYTKFYDVFNNKTQEFVCVYQNSIQCAKKMGCSINTFHSTVSKVFNGKNRKWKITKYLSDGSAVNSKQN